MKSIKLFAILFLTYFTLFAQTGCSSDEKKAKPETGSENSETGESDSTEASDTSVTGLSATSDDIQSKPKKINTEQFKELVFNYDKNPDNWVFEGDLPTIVDFYADWCKPCKMIAPTLEKLQEKYKGKIRVYKINTDENPGLSQYFQIQGIPALLFIPMEGQPQMASGALPEADLEKAIQEVMKVK